MADTPLNYNLSGAWSTAPYGWQTASEKFLDDINYKSGKCGGSGNHGHSHGHSHGHNDDNQEAGLDSDTDSESGQLVDKHGKVHINMPPLTGEHSDRILLLNVPLLGRLQLVKNRQGALSLSFIVFYWVYGNWSTWTLILLPQFKEGHVAKLLMFWYAAVSVLCLVSLFKSATINPGRIPYSEEKAPSPVGESDWTVCVVCQRKRPPKAHHCSKCKQCVLRMDHHCPWINNCVGEENRYLFLQLVFYAFLLSFTTLLLHIWNMYYAVPCQLCDMDSFAFRHQNFFMYLAMVMGVLMSLGGSGLALTQHISIVMDMTTIDWMKLQSIIQKTKKWPSQDEMPGRSRTYMQTYRDLCGPGSMLLWPFPCHKKQPSQYFVQGTHYI